jgi:hypothetical protein
VIKAKTGTTFFTNLIQQLNTIGQIYVYQLTGEHQFCRKAVTLPLVNDRWLTILGVTD